MIVLVSYFGLFLQTKSTLYLLHISTLPYIIPFTKPNRLTNRIKGSVVYFYGIPYF